MILTVKIFVLNRGQFWDKLADLKIQHFIFMIYSKSDHSIWSYSLKSKEIQKQFFVLII